MKQKIAHRWAVTAVVAVVAAVFAAPVTAGAQPMAPVDPGLLAAMRHDLGLTADQARTQIERDLRGGAIERTLSARLGASFAGAWFAPGAERLTVALTDPARAGEVRAAGAEPRVVPRNYRQLEQIRMRLDRAGQVPASVPGWYVDIVANTVTVLTHPKGQNAAKSFVRSAGVAPESVRLVESGLRPRPLYDVRGGDEYRIDGRTICSIGFSVNGGYVTAGHCGRVGSRTAGGNGVDQGTFQASVFPGSDYAYVAVNSQWTPRGVVNRYNGTTVPVAGSQEAPVGAAVCRSGRTTGWRCGTILGKNESVTYPEGTINGMTRTNACAEPGDSGGSWLTGDQAQGVTSGGSGNCTQGGTIWFFPLNPILTRLGLTLVTDGGGPGEPGDCSGVAAWNSSTNYSPGQVVSHNARKWESTHWSTGAEPGHPGSWAVWKDSGPCPS